MGKVIGIVGSRRRDTSDDAFLLITEFSRIYNPGDTIVSGGCDRGADAFAESIAKDRGLTITIHYPDWRGQGKAAGPMRNAKIAADCTVLLALPAPDRIGGTESTIRHAERLGKKVILL